MSNLSLPWGNETISVNVPENWKIMGILEPSSIPPVNVPSAEVERSLNDPIGLPGLESIAAPGMKVVIIIDDISRPTPVKEIFPKVLERLREVEVKNERICIIPALGVHRGMEESEILERTGLTSLDGIQWENPNPDLEEGMKNLGTTSRGTPVWINKTAAEADLVISIGCIEPHIIASFGGGYKNILPGIAGRTSIAHNHSLNCQPQTFNMVGQPIDQNPMRLDLEEAGKMLHGKVFIVNAILDNHQRLVRIVCGDPIVAHRKGVQVSAELYGVEIPSKADIVITDSHPMNSDLRQGVKALANTIRALKPGGVLITVVRAEEGVGVFGLANKKLPVGKSALRILAPIILPLVTRLKLKGMGEEDRFFLYFALQAMRMGTLLLFAPTIPLEIHERLPFVSFVNSVEEGIELAQQRYPKEASVLIFPNGGITYPILKK